MRNVNKLFLVALGLFASYTAQAQVGIGTITPRSMLDINGAVSVAETTAAVSSNAATIPLGYSLVRLTGTATAAVALTAASSPAPVAGQQLVIYNGLSGYSATFAGQSIVPGQAVALLYTDGAWRPVATSAVAAAGSNWGLAGNAGTAAGTNFVGTTDNVDLLLKRNNVQAAQLRNGNTSFGLATLLYSSDSLSTAFGYKAGQGDGVGTSAGSANQFIGHQSGYKSRIGTHNQFSGFQSGYNNTGSNNQFSGYQSGYSNTTGYTNQFIGYQSGYANTTGNTNLFVGYQSGYSNTTSIGNQFTGIQSGYMNTTGYANQFNGFMSGFYNSTGSNNQFSGYQSGFFTSTGSNNQFSGAASGRSNTTGHSNLYIGLFSGYNGTTSSYTTILGDSAGIKNTANFNQFMGYQSGYANTSGGPNQFSGYRSGYANTTGNNNLFVGYQSGYANTTGSNNQFIGYQSGRTNTTGSNNTLLGYNSNVATAALTNATAIGYLAQVNQSNSLVLGSINGINGATANTFVGIGTTTPSVPLDIAVSQNFTSSGTYGYYSSSASGQGYTATLNNVSLRATGRIVANEFNAFSDVRLKTVLSRSDGRADLALVQQLQVTNYQMKDKAQYGEQRFKKVIAQQVEAVYPQAIHKNTGFIPSIYAIGTLRAGAAGQTLVTVPAAHALKVGDKVRLIGEANGKIETKVLALSGDNTFAVALPQPETKLFVFGPEVADLRTVDYEALAMLNVSATQELARHVAALQAENTGLRASLADKASASTLTELQAALQTLRAEVQTLRAAGTTASLK